MPSESEKRWGAHACRAKWVLPRYLRGMNSTSTLVVLCVLGKKSSVCFSYVVLTNVVRSSHAPLLRRADFLARW